MAQANIQAEIGLDDKKRTVRIGKSFLNDSSSTFSSLRFDFKAKSVADSHEMYIEQSDGNDRGVKVNIPSGDEQFFSFKGHSSKDATRDCVLIIDEETGEITLEKVSTNIILKSTGKVKSIGNFINTPPSNSSSDKLKTPPSNTSSIQPKTDSDDDGRLTDSDSDSFSDSESTSTKRSNSLSNNSSNDDSSSSSGEETSDSEATTNPPSTIGFGIETPSPVNDVTFPNVNSNPSQPPTPLQRNNNPMGDVIDILQDLAVSDDEDDDDGIRF